MPKDEFSQKFLTKICNICDELDINFWLDNDNLSILDFDSLKFLKFLNKKYKDKLCLKLNKEEIKIHLKNKDFKFIIRLKKNKIKNKIPKKEIVNFILTFNDTIRNSLDQFEKILDKYSDKELNL